MSRIDTVAAAAPVSAPLAAPAPAAAEDDDAFLRLWLRMGRLAMFFCLWSAMALPVLLILSVR